eukprot:TRINITY_DN2451_c0_g1_i2.p1 TRINITY_DN2451_c0_g1~~TRINITY_DN2451_c0_g1_i2.p1  ORF type:complete len:253 (-),score=137.47 TRINITY_DN2451_c0_g1_i2:77-736(-)
MGSYSDPSSITSSLIMSGIKLTYFNLKGRAELARLILAQAEVEYEDCRIEKEEWAELKKGLPLGQLPVLEVEGQTIGQSMTIARYLARRFGLAGKADIDAAEADQAVDALNDLMNNVLPIRKETDEEKKAELKKKLQMETMPSWMKMMEGLLTSKGGNYFAGNQLTWADIAIYHSSDMMKRMLGEPNMEECPNMKKLMETVNSLPNIKKWEEARPSTPF